MLTLIFGAPGSGKTTRILDLIRTDLAAATPAFLIVPEQNTVSAEAFAARALPPDAPFLFEVTNFTRLADTVFRRVGGVAGRYADGETAALLAREAVAEAALAEGKPRRTDPAHIREVLATVRELRTSSITPELLADAAEAIGEEDALGRKLSDMSTLLVAFEGVLATHGTALPGDSVQRLAEVLLTSPVLSDARFYLDGFTSFTAVQRAVLLSLLRRTDLTVTLPMPAEGTENALCYAELHRTRKDLNRLASEAGTSVSVISLTENLRAKRGVLAEVGARLFRIGAPPLPPAAEDERETLRIFECRTPYAEAEFIAADIARRVQEGARYRDFTIIARKAEDYRGVLDTALARHKIPAYFSLPTDLSAFEPIKLIRTAYAVLTDGGRREDVITYAKCGLSGIKDDECDRFELYAERWGLTGKKLLRLPYRMYPDGYSPPPYENARAEAEESLAILNSIRERILTPLSILEDACKENLTAKEHCRILYDFLSALEVEKQLYRKAEEYAAAGDMERADEYSRLFPTVTATLDTLCDATPEAHLSAAEFSELLALLFSTKTMRTIPPRADALTVGSADLLRPNEPRHVYLIGVNAGVFPRGGEEGGIFTAAEIERLAEHGIRLDGDEVVRASREYYCFLRAFLAASESVTISYFLSDFAFIPTGRSEALERILAMEKDRFPIRRAEDVPLFSRLYSEEGLAAAMSAPLSPTERSAVLLTMERLGLREEAEARAATALVEPRVRAGAEVMGEVYGNRMQLSQSRIEQYVGCPFSFFCKYVLKLSENERITFHSGEVGTYIHAILEHFYAGDTEGELATLDEEEIRRRVEALTAAYLAGIFPEGSEIPPRLAHRFCRLGNLAVRMMLELREEARCSSYRPILFEYEPSESDPTHPEPLRMTLSDGTALTLTGKIDRVDVYHKDGDAYLRIVDYKTGAKTFSRSNIEKGKNLQLLIYLFTMWRSGRPEFLRAIGAEGGKVIPAGALYLNLSLSPARLERPSDTPPPLASRSGIFLHDEASLDAMDPRTPKLLIPLKYDKEGNLSDAEHLATLEEMGDLADQVERKVREIGEGIRCGRADATPLAADSRGPCDYCRFSPICRNVGGGVKADD